MNGHINTTSDITDVHNYNKGDRQDPNAVTAASPYCQPKSVGAKGDFWHIRSCHRSNTSMVAVDWQGMTSH